LAQEGTFSRALQYLDKATILGLKRSNLGDFFAYVELFASQMSATPCPHAIHCTIPDHGNIELKSDVISRYLSSPIRFPVPKESSYEDFPNGESGTKWDNNPMVIRGLAKEWPAITKWRNMESISRQHGHRLVPIELGSILTGMTEDLVSLRSFISTYLARSNEKVGWSLDDAIHPPAPIAYLAQHPLLDQIPDLYQDVDRNPCGIEPTNVNIWMGTGGTRTPLHFDSYDNLLIQLVGVKYVRLYDPDQTARLYVSRDEGYGRQGNMSEVNCEMEDLAKHPLVKDATFTEVVLFPGDCLYIPSRHWHYVRSLSTSMSVNYWF
jgi:lysine-specific demethylase 8